MVSVIPMANIFPNLQEWNCVSDTMPSSDWLKFNLIKILRAASSCQSPDRDFRQPEKWGKIKLFRKLFPLFQSEKFVSAVYN